MATAAVAAATAAVVEGRSSAYLLISCSSLLSPSPHLDSGSERVAGFSHFSKWEMMAADYPTDTLPMVTITATAEAAMAAAAVATEAAAVVTA